MNSLKAAWQAIKATTVRLTTRAYWGGWFAGSGSFDFLQSVPDGGRQNSIVAACVKWMSRTMPEAPVMVQERTADAGWEKRPDHSLQELLDWPNPHYSGVQLIAATVADWVFGDAYWVKRRSDGGRVVELWWIPSWMMEPKWPDDGSAFISHYEQTIDGQVQRWATQDVIHFRNGIDPRNPRKGDGIKALFREIATDEEAAGWTAAMVHNVNPPGVVLSPENNMEITADNAERVKSQFTGRFGGEHRGEPLVMGSATKVSVLSFSPQQMDLRSIRNVPEERITAHLGLPAAVVGLGTGLTNTKVGATMAEMREQAYESCLIPVQRLLAADLNRQLIPEFGDRRKLRVGFDLSEVRVLQDDQNERHGRAREDLKAGLVTLNQALQMIGEDAVDGEAGDVRYIPTTVTVKAMDALLPEPVPAALEPGQTSPALPATAGTAKRTSAHDGVELGEPMDLSDEELDRLSKVSERDLDGAERFWREAVAGTGLEDLMSAKTVNADKDDD